MTLRVHDNSFHHDFDATENPRRGPAHGIHTGGTTSLHLPCSDASRIQEAE